MVQRLPGRLAVLGINDHNEHPDYRGQTPVPLAFLLADSSAVQARPMLRARRVARLAGGVTSASVRSSSSSRSNGRPMGHLKFGCPRAKVTDRPTDRPEINVQTGEPTD